MGTLKKYRWEFGWVVMALILVAIILLTAFSPMPQISGGNCTPNAVGSIDSFGNVGCLSGGGGATGATGATGPTGANGTNGTNGTNGSNGATGATGANGTNGTNGTNGANGATGSTGATGPTGGGQVFEIFVNATFLGSGATVYAGSILGTASSASSISAWSGTEANRQFPMGRAGTWSNLYCNTATAQGASSTLTVTLRSCTPSGSPLTCSASSTALTFTISAGSGAGLYGDTSHSVSTNAGDLVDFQIVNSAGSNSATPSGCSVLFQ